MIPPYRRENTCGCNVKCSSDVGVGGDQLTESRDFSSSTDYVTPLRNTATDPMEIKAAETMWPERLEWTESQSPGSSGTDGGRPLQMKGGSVRRGRARTAIFRAEVPELRVQFERTPVELVASKARMEGLCLPEKLVPTPGQSKVHVSPPDQCECLTYQACKTRHGSPGKDVRTPPGPCVRRPLREDDLEESHEQGKALSFVLFIYIDSCLNSPMLSLMHA